MLAHTKFIQGYKTLNLLKGQKVKITIFAFIYSF